MAFLVFGLLAGMQFHLEAVVLHQGGGSGARINVDVAGYRAKRREALAAFALQLADGVKANGTAKALEPMSAADRKVVHDTIQEIGLTSESEGEDPDRCVVVLPN